MLHLLLGVLASFSLPETPSRPFGPSRISPSLVRVREQHRSFHDSPPLGGGNPTAYCAPLAAPVTQGSERSLGDLPSLSWPIRGEIKLLLVDHQACWKPYRASCLLHVHFTTLRGGVFGNWCKLSLLCIKSVVLLTGNDRQEADL